MEQAQLYKRLYDMTMAELSEFISPEENISATILKLNRAGNTRLIIENIQFEDVWQNKNPETGEREVFLEFKLAPYLLMSSFSIQANLNELTWRLVFAMPKNNPSPPDVRSIVSFLDFRKRVEILAIEKYDIADACAALDLAYDFSADR